jgi:hypothetical protein
VTARRSTRARRPRHRPGCAHCFRVRLLGRDFHGWRATWEDRLEAEANGYDTEGEIFRQENPAPTFQNYLITMTGHGWAMCGQRPRRHFA